MRYRDLIVVVAATVLITVPVTGWAAGTFAADIEWMADTGISSGCGNGNYCPGDSVTRAQMAAFMHRLATFGVVDAATASTADNAADSDALNGQVVDDFATALAAEDDGLPGSQLESNAGLVEINSVTIDAPTDGVLIISGTSFVDPESVVTDYVLQTKIDGAVVGLAGWSAWFRPAADSQSFELSYTVAEPVTAGQHTVTQLVGPRVGTASFFHNHETLTVVFVPTGQASFESNSGTATGAKVASELGGEAD